MTHGQPLVNYSNYTLTLTEENWIQNYLRTVENSNSFDRPKKMSLEVGVNVGKLCRAGQSPVHQAECLPLLLVNVSA